MARFVLITLVIAACGGDDGGGGNGGNPDGQPQPAEELSCKSIALCTTFDVKTFLGTVSTPTGGTLKNGLYKFAYEIRPDNVNEDGGYTEDLEALVISGNQYNWAGLFRNELGTLTVSGTTATFQATRRCERGTDQGESTNKLEYPFTATDREIHLFSHVTRSDGVEWDDEQVYLRVDDPSTVCNAVANEPSTPGDSVQCRVTNCACSFAVNDTVAECN
jgi:hypothetical protein